MVHIGSFIQHVSYCFLMPAFICRYVFIAMCSFLRSFWGRILWCAVICLQQIGVCRGLKNAVRLCHRVRHWTFNYVVIQFIVTVTVTFDLNMSHLRSVWGHYQQTRERYYMMSTNVKIPQHSVTQRQLLHSDVRAMKFDPHFVPSDVTLTLHFFTSLNYCTWRM